MAASLRSLLRSAASTVVQLGEDPKVLVDHLFQDLEEMIPTLDREQLWSASGIQLLEQELEALEARERDLLPALEAALGRDDGQDLVLALAAQFEVIQAARRATLAQLQVFRQAHRHSLETKRRILSRLQDRCREVAGYLPSGEEADWRIRVYETVQKLSRVELDPEIQSAVQDIQRKILEQEAERQLASSPDSKKLDLIEERARLSGLDVVETLRRRRSDPSS